MAGYILESISSDGNTKKLMLRILSNLLSLLIVTKVSAIAQITNFTIQAEADAFVRAASPDENYGRAGNLSVAGTEALNGFGAPGGRTESLARFETANLVAGLDSFYGNHDWFIAEAVIRAYEMAAPNNAIFSRGLGAFAITALSKGADWIEGSGSPNAPTTDGVTFNDLADLFEATRDLRLGSFTNSLVDGFHDFTLALPNGFTAMLESGLPVTLRFFPLDDEIGFTFLSRSDRRTELQMTLSLKVSNGPAPKILSIARARPDTVVISFVQKANWTTRLLKAADVAGEQWQTFFTTQPEAVDQTLEVTDSSAASSQFYRLEAFPP